MVLYHRRITKTAPLFTTVEERFRDFLKIVNFFRGLSQIKTKLRQAKPQSKAIN